MDSPSDGLGRRGFLASLGAATIGAMFANRVALATDEQPAAMRVIDGPDLKNEAGMPVRKFGRTDTMVSILGVGGHAIGKLPSEADAIRLIHEAIDSGVTFMDNAWEYHDGKSEDWMGKAIQDRRDKVFLMTKVCTHGRGKDDALKQLDESLRRLKTDHLDLWQVHEVIYDNDPELHFAPSGVMEALTAAKESGKVRYVGFTGHKDPSIHLKMLSYNYAFDACQLPLNCFDANFRSFEKQVLPVLKQNGIAPIGMKSLNGTADAVKKGVISAEDAMRYVLTLPISTLVSGMDSPELLRKNIAMARSFQPLAAQDMEAIRERVRPLAGDGRFELYKTSKKFDGPPGREQHGFPPQEKLQG